jgi:hypothetical protein
MLGLAGAHTYTAAKGAMINLTRSMCVAYAAEGIRSNCIAPGFIATPMVASVLNLFDDPAVAQSITPMKRPGTAEEMAYGCLYLASDEASYCNGSVLVIDGGTSARQYAAGIFMAKHVFLSLLNAQSGRDGQFNDWYRDVHLPDVLTIPGFVSAQRFRLSAAQLPGMEGRWQYLVIYEIDGASPDAALAELARRMRSGMIISDALAPDVAAWAFTAQEARHEAKR